MDFGEVRSLVNTTDDAGRAEAWPRLLGAMKAALKKRPDEVSDVWMPYVLQALERWPDHVRVAPRDWVHTIIRGERVGVLMALVTAIDANRINNPRMRLMCEREDFTWVRHLHFGGFDFKLATAKAFGASSAFANLRSLSFHGSNLGLQKIRAIMSNSAVDDLTALRMSDCNLGGHDITSMLKVASFGALERLDLSENHLDEPCITALAKGHFPRLKVLDLTSAWVHSGDLDILLDAPWIPQLDELRLARSPVALYRDIPFERRSANIQALNIEQNVRRRILDSDLRPEVASATARTIQ